MNYNQQSLTARIGQLLFRFRQIAGLAGFILLFYFGKPRPQTLLNGLILIIPGLLLRFWSAGYIGRESRKPRIDASRIVVGGPYRYFRHPLYSGNFALVAGFVITLNPPLVIGILVLFGYLVIYGLISKAETEFLSQTQPLPQKTEFRIPDALWEWQTWLVTGIAYAIGWLKWLLFINR